MAQHFSLDALLHTSQHMDAHHYACVSVLSDFVWSLYTLLQT